MAKLPGIEDLGPVPTPAATRPVGSYDVSGLARGGQALAQGAEQLGRGIQQAGQGAGELALDESHWQYAQAHAQFLVAKSQADFTAAQDPNYGPDASGKSLPNRYADSVWQARDNAAASIQDPRMRELFNSHVAETVQKGINAANSHYVLKRNNADVAAADTTGIALMDAAVKAPDDDTRRDLADAHNELIDGLVTRGALTPEQAVGRKQAWAHQYATADILSRADTDPQGVINELQAAPGSNDEIVNRIIKNESGGDPRAKASTSSAYGAAQFLESRPGGDQTWKQLLDQYHPELTKGRSLDEINALRADPNLSREMLGHLVDNNRSYLQGKGLEATPGNLYLTHFLGPAGAAAVIAAPPGTPVIDALTKTVGPGMAQKMVDANQSVLGGKLAGSVTAWSDRKMGGATPGAGSIYDQLRPDIREQLLTHARQQLDKQTVNDLTDFKQRITDSQAEGSRTGAVAQPIEQSEFITHLGAVEGPKAYQQYRENLQTGIDIQHVAGMSYEEQENLLQGYAVQPGQPGYANAAKRQDDVIKEIQRVRQLRAKDPEFKARVDSTIEEADRTGQAATPVSQDEFVAHLGPEDGQRAYAHYSASLRLGRDAKSVADLNPQEQQLLLHGDPYLGGYEPQPGIDYPQDVRAQQVVAKAIDQVNKERADDPAGFAIQRLPAASAAWQAFAATFANPQATDDQRKAAAQKYAATTLMEQRRVGVAPELQRILPASYVDHLNTSISASADSDDPQKRTGLVTQIGREAAMWGGQWPAVMRQLAPGSQPIVRAIAAQFDGSGNPEPGADLPAMTRLLSLPKDEAKRPATILAQQNDTKFKDLTTAVNDAMAPFRRSMVGRQLDRDFPGYNGLAVELGALYARDGDSATDAAAKAFKSLIGGRYDFKDTWRMPKSSGVTADDVQAGTLAARQALGGDIKVKPAIDDMGLTDNRGDSMQKFSRDGVFVTSPDNSGLNLSYNNKLVRGEDGKPLLLPWADLAKRGKGWRADENAGIAAGGAAIP